MSKEKEVLRPMKKVPKKSEKVNVGVCEKKKVLLDFKSILIKLEQEKGIKLTLSAFAEQNGFNRMSITKMGKKAPDVVGLLYNFLKDYNLDFFDVVKEVIEHD
jgi:hypothetical protein